MSAAKLIVLYPPPQDLDAFDSAYRNEHIPMAAAIFQRAGASKAILSHATGSPDGAPAFHRIAEIHFPSLTALQACAASSDGQAALAHAQKISTGGAPVVMIAEEETINF